DFDQTLLTGFSLVHLVILRFEGNAQQPPDLNFIVDDEGEWLHLATDFAAGIAALSFVATGTAATTAARNFMRSPLLWANASARQGEGEWRIGRRRFDDFARRSRRHALQPAGGQWKVPIRDRRDECADRDRTSRTLSFLPREPGPDHDRQRK